MEDFHKEDFHRPSSTLAHIMCIHILLGEIKTKASSCREARECKLNACPRRKPDFGKQ